MSDYIISQILPSTFWQTIEDNELALHEGIAEMQILTTPAVCMMMR